MVYEGTKINKAFSCIADYLQKGLEQQSTDLNQMNSSLSNKTLKLEYLLSLLIALYVFKFIINFFKLIIKILTYVLLLFIIFRMFFDLFSSTKDGFPSYKLEDFKLTLLNITSETLGCLKTIFFSFLAMFLKLFR
ncbi:MAG: hypothetical protein AM1032_000395 [Mycoplasmataceae bacterium]|nr:MAG: hypothetical protein AM1032_000395 [Mycoplasmataceae bacterium]